MPFLFLFPSVLGCREAGISSLGSPRPSPEKGALLKDCTQAQEARSPRQHAERSRPTQPAVCRIFSSRQCCSSRFSIKLQTVLAVPQLGLR